MSVIGLSIDTSRLIFLFLDIASGSTVDWAYDVLKIPFAYTIELPPSFSKNFEKKHFI